MKIVYVFLAFFVIATFVYLYAYVPFWIKRRIIKHKHSLQLRAIQAQARNPLQMAKHPKGIETYYSAAACLASGGLIYALWSFFAVAYFILSIIHNEGIKELPYQFIIDYILPYTLFYYLLDLAVFYIRMARGCIQGAIIFDPQEKKIYAFPSLNSDYYLGGYKEYHESELVYTTESYGWSRSNEEAYVFFTRDKNEYAFKVGDMKENNLGEMLSQQEPADIPIPFKYRFHTVILIFVSFFLYFLSTIWVIPSLPKAP